MKKFVSYIVVASTLLGAGYLWGTQRISEQRTSIQPASQPSSSALHSPSVTSFNQTAPQEVDARPADNFSIDEEREAVIEITREDVNRWAVALNLDDVKRRRLLDSLVAARTAPGNENTEGQFLRAFFSSEELKAIEAADDRMRKEAAEDFAWSRMHEISRGVLNLTEEQKDQIFQQEAKSRLEVEMDEEDFLRQILSEEQYQRWANTEEQFTITADN